MRWGAWAVGLPLAVAASNPLPCAFTTLDPHHIISNRGSRANPLRPRATTLEEIRDEKFLDQRVSLGFGKLGKSFNSWESI